MFLPMRSIARFAFFGTVHAATTCSEVQSIVLGLSILVAKMREIILNLRRLGTEFNNLERSKEYENPTA